MTDRRCSKCDRPHYARGLCGAHYQYWRRKQSTGVEKQTQLTFPENLLRRLRFMPDGCIEFTGHRLSEGYGHLSVKGKLMLAHRASYELFVGPIPDGLEMDHLCVNPPCVNPAHLEPVTNAENQRRRWERYRAAKAAA